jgi:hypothetical protein
MHSVRVCPDGDEPVNPAEREAGGAGNPALLEELGKCRLRSAPEYLGNLLLCFCVYMVCP